MINDLYHYSTPVDATSFRYSDIEGLLLAHNIKFYHLLNHKEQQLIINHDIELESDNNFWNWNNTLPRMGAFSYTCSNLGYGVKIGRYSSIADGVKIMGAEHFSTWISTSPGFYEDGYHDLDSNNISHINRLKRRVNIGNDVWIGADVVLKADINIGNGAIIASNSVVTKDVAPYTIVGGVPARVIKPRFDEEVIAQLQNLQWWRFHRQELQGLKFNKPKDFLAELKERINLQSIQVYQPKKVIFQDILNYMNSAHTQQ